MKFSVLPEKLKINTGFLPKRGPGKAASILMSFVSTAAALIIIKIAIPFFNDLLGTTLTLDFTAAWYIFKFIAIFPLVTGILAASYPAFFLAYFNPNQILLLQDKSGPFNLSGRFNNHNGDSASDN